MNTREDLKALLDRLATQRDEIIVQAHLATLQAQDNWHQLEQQLEHLRAKTLQAAEITGDTSRELLAAAKLMGEEIARGYERLRKTL